MIRSCLLVSATLFAPGWAAGSEVESFDTFVSAFRNEHRVQSLSVAVAKRGEMLFAKGYGYQDHDAEEVATPDTTYLAASITKTFTAVTLLAMEADGHIRLSDQFTTLSDWDGRCRWLAGSGIIFGGGRLDDGTVVDPVPCDQPLTIEQVLRHQVNGIPGTQFLYNPVVFGRLSNWIEENTPRTWREWMDHYVMDRAALENVAAGWRDPDKGHVLTQLAPPFRHTDTAIDPDGVAASVLPNPELNASSGIIASAVSLANYGSALLSGKIVEKRLVERMWTPTTLASGDPAPYGLGWYVQDINGKRVVWHGGWWPDAYAGLLMIVPDDGLVFAALGNTDGLHWGNPLNEARVQDSKLAAGFLEMFVDQASD